MDTPSISTSYLNFLPSGHPIWAAILVFALATFVLLFVKRQIWKRLEIWAGRSQLGWDDQLVRVLNRPVNLLVLVLALQLALQFTPAEIRANPSVVMGFKVVLILSLIWLGARGVSTFLLFGGLPVAMTEATRRLLSSVTQGVIFGLGALVILDTVGVSITPILASLGVGSLAVALALQDTLGNFFSGIYLLIDKPIRVGDYVRVEDGIEGFVRRIGWRSTHIQQLSNNMVVIPNSKLSTSTLINFDLPEKELSVLLEVGVGYDSDLEKVERVTIDSAQEVVKRVTGGVPGILPFIRFHTFADSSVGFTVIIRAQQFTDQYLLKHELIKALHRRYANEGIEIPFPQRVVQIKGGGG